MILAPPSARFSRGQQNAQTPLEPMNFFAPPKNLLASNSSDPPTNVSQYYAPAYQKPAPEETRPGSMTKTAQQLAAEASAKRNLSGLSAAGAGFANSQVVATTDTTAQAVNIGGNVISGAISGAVAGAPAGGIGAVPGAVIGGGLALVTSGLNAWLGARQARAERDRQAKLKAEAERIRREDIARDEKWAKQNRFDNLETAKEERRRFEIGRARQRMLDTANMMNNALATNASLRDHWQKYGFN